MTISESSAALIEANVQLLRQHGLPDNLVKLTRVALQDSHLDGKKEGFFDGAKALVRQPAHGIQVLSSIVEAHQQVREG